MLYIFEDEQEASAAVAAEMKQALEREEHPLFCLAAGSTPRKSYDFFIEKCRKDDLIHKAEFIGLDEWVGIPGNMAGSCYQMLDDDLFKHLPIAEDKIHFFHTVGTDLQVECQKADALLKKRNITFSLMGVGMNGHIGLNEPGSPIRDHSSVVPLSDTTKEVAKKYFSEKVLLEEGITLGLQQIMDSDRVAVVILGEHKAKIVKQIMEEKNLDIPAARLLGYQHIDFFLDKRAAQLLKHSML